MLKLLFDMILLGLVIGIAIIGIGVGLALTPYVLGFLLSLVLIALVAISIGAAYKACNANKAKESIFDALANYQMARQEKARIKPITDKEKILSKEQSILYSALGSVKSRRLYNLLPEQSKMICSLNNEKFLKVCFLGDDQFYRFLSLTSKQMNMIRFLDQDKFLTVCTLHNEMFDYALSLTEDKLIGYIKSIKNQSRNVKIDGSKLIMDVDHKALLRDPDAARKWLDSL